MRVVAPCSAGDLLDRITILGIKVRRLDGARQALALNELRELNYVRVDHDLHYDRYSLQFNKLNVVNERLWDVEERIRYLLISGTSHPEFVRCAVEVPQLNDERAALKREINRLSGSEIVEVKSYEGG